MNSTIRAGIFVFIALVVGAIVISVVEDVDIFKKGRIVYAYYDRVTGLEVGARVRLAGVEVGRVEALEIENNQVKVTMRVDDKGGIRSDSVAELKIVSLMGNSQIHISMGSPDSPPLQGSLLQSHRGLDFQEIMDSGGNAMQQADATFLEVQRLVADLGQTQAKLSQRIVELVERYDLKVEESMDHLHVTTLQIKEVSERLNAIMAHVQAGEGTVGKMLMADDFHQELLSITRKAQEIEDQVSGILLDNREELAKLVEQGNMAVAKLNDALESVKNILAKVEEGEGTLGKFVHDETIYEEAAGGIQQAREFFGRSEKLKIFLGAAGLLDTETDGMDGEVYLRLEPTEDKYYLIGAHKLSRLDDKDEETSSSDDDDIEIDVQIAKRFARDWTIRGGLFRTTPGIALDYDVPWEFNPKLSLELYDPSEDEPPSLDFRVRWNAWKWFYVFGEARDLLDDVEMAAGLGLEFRDEDLKYVIGILGAAK